VSESKRGLFAKIESRDDAVKTVREAANAFFFLAALQAAVGFFLFPAMITDAVILCVLGLVLRMWYSRVAAVLLLLVTGTQGLVTVLNRFGVTTHGGTNIFLAFIMLVIAVRAVEATFKLHGTYREEMVGA
jgi:uncharacterized membrane protein